MTRHFAQIGAVVSLLVAAGLGLTSSAPAAPALATVEGTIASIQANHVTIATGARGEIRVEMTARTCVAIRRPARLGDITPGQFIGVAATRQGDGTLTAVFINLFPPSLKPCIPAGQRRMESGNIMTNAVVAAAVRRVAGSTLTLTSPRGTATIHVPSGIPIHRLLLVPRGSLRPGMRVLVRGARDADGSVTASVLLVE